MLPLAWDMGHHDLDWKQNHDQSLDSSPTTRQEILAGSFIGEDFIGFSYQLNVHISYYSKLQPRRSVPGCNWLRTLGDEWDIEWPPAQLEPCPTATETDTHANHNRNDRPAPPSNLPPRQSFQSACQLVSLPVQRTTSYPTRGSTPVPAQTDLDKLGQSPPPLPPTLPLHCALQQPLLRGLIPRSNHHLYLLCWHN